MGWAVSGGNSKFEVQHISALVLPELLERIVASLLPHQPEPVGAVSIVAFLLPDQLEPVGAINMPINEHLNVHPITDAEQIRVCKNIAHKVAV